MKLALLVGAVSAATVAVAYAADAPKPSANPATAQAQPTDRRVPDSLMFGIDELNDIQSRATAVREGDEQKKGQPSGQIENASLYVSTIVYYGPNDWTAWVNGVPIGPRQEFQAFKITDIGPRFVELVVPLSAQGMRPVRLAPNQTFIAKTGTVVEGQWR